MGRTRRQGTGENSAPAVPKPRVKKPPKPPSTRTRNGYKYDWFEVKSSFIEGIKDGSNPDERVFLNLKDLAERMEVPLQLMRVRSADERWFEQREQYQLRLSKSKQTKRILELSKESVDFDSKSLNLAKLGMAMVTARMSEIAREVQESQRRREDALKMAQQGHLIDPNDLATVIDAKELDTLSRAANQWQVLGQKALGTDIQRMEIQQEIQANIDVDIEVTSISAELGRDDPERLAQFLQAAKRAGLLEAVLDVEFTEDEDGEDVEVYEQLEIESGEDEEIVDAEIVG